MLCLCTDCYMACLGRVMKFNLELENNRHQAATSRDMQKNIDAFDRMLKTGMVGGDFVALLDVKNILLEMQRQMGICEVY